MKLTVKTLKGGKFEVEVDDGSTVSQVKGVIVSAHVWLMSLSLSPFTNDIARQ
jgi:hypothetical protein